MGEIKIETVDEFIAYGYTVSSWCWRCRKFREDFDLPMFARRGFGGCRPIDLDQHCIQCRTRLLINVRAEPRHAQNHDEPIRGRTAPAL